MKRLSFEAKSGRLIIADPHMLGYSEKEIQELLFKRVKKGKRSEYPFLIVPQGVIYSPFTKEIFDGGDGEQIYLAGQEESLHVFRHGDNFALTKESDTYTELGRDRFLDHFFIEGKGENGEMDDASYMYAYPDIPLGKMIGLEGFVFNPQKLAEDKKALRKMKSKSPYLFDVLADACNVLIGDAEVYSRPRNKWVDRFPESKYGSGKLDEVDIKLISKSYKQIVDVTPGTFLCEYSTRWATAMIKRKTD